MGGGGAHTTQGVCWGPGGLGRGGSCPHPSPLLCPLQPVPFVATIPGGLIPKKTIVVKGYIPPDAKRYFGGEGEGTPTPFPGVPSSLTPTITRPPPPRFHINLRAGPGGDVLLHLNPRLDEGVVVRNSLLGGVWGSEEHDLPHNPFQRGRYFDVSARGRGWGGHEGGCHTWVGAARGFALHKDGHHTRVGVARGFTLREDPQGRGTGVARGWVSVSHEGTPCTRACVAHGCSPRSHPSSPSAAGTIASRCSPRGSRSATSPTACPRDPTSTRWRCRATSSSPTSTSEPRGRPHSPAHGLTHSPFSSPPTPPHGCRPGPSVPPSPPSADPNKAAFARVPPSPPAAAP